MDRVCCSAVYVYNGNGGSEVVPFSSLRSYKLGVHQEVFEILFFLLVEKNFIILKGIVCCLCESYFSMCSVVL